MIKIHTYECVVWHYLESRVNISWKMSADCSSSSSSLLEKYTMARDLRCDTFSQFLRLFPLDSVNLSASDKS